MSETLCKLELVNRNTNSTLSVVFFAPELSTWFDEELQRDLSSWITHYEIELDGQKKNYRAAGVDWLQAFLMALEGVRVKIPAEEAEIWETPDGLPSWMALPRCLPIAWGYEVFKEAEDSVELIVNRVHREIENKHRLD